MSSPRDEWRRLDAETRRAVLRNGRRSRPHPDPSVSAVAARFSRWYLDAAQHRERRLTVFAVVGITVVAIIIQTAVSSGPPAGRAGTGEKALIVAIGIAAAAAVFVLHFARVFSFARVEIANRLALGGPQPTFTRGPAPAPQEPTAAADVPEPPAGAAFAARNDPRRIMRLGGLLFLGMCAIAAYGWWQVAGRGHVNVALLALAGVLTAGGLLSIVPLTVVLVRSVVAPRPVVAMDSGGLQLPDFAGSLPWAELAEVRLISGRGFPRSGQPYTIVAFVPRDPAGVLSSLRPTGRRRRKLEKLLQLYGTPLVVADLLADHSGAEIAAAAAAFTVAPVRRF